MNVPRPQRSLQAAFMIGLAVAVLVLTSCGGGGSSNSTTPTVDVTSQTGSTFPSMTPAGTRPSVTSGPSPSPTSPRTPTALPASTPIVGDVNLTGHVADDIPGTLIAVGATITSVVDKDTKPRDVYAITMTAGTKYKVYLDPTNPLGNQFQYELDVGNPGSKSFDGEFTGSTSICFAGHQCALQFPPAVSGVYFFSMSTFYVSALGYTFHIVECAPTGQDSCSSG